jgi:DNA-binding response OmpR family regulator
MKKHIILIVDDDALIVDTLKKKFSVSGTEVYTASTPEQAKEILEKIFPEVVVLDLLLTKDDGSQGVLDFMKSKPALEHVPVIVLTNMDKPEIKKLLLTQGVKEYLIKGSLSLDEIHKKVFSYLEPGNNN